MLTYYQRALVVLLVLLVGEDVDEECRGGVEESEHSDSDEELSGGRVVPDEEEALRVSPRAGGGVEVHHVHPGDNRTLVFYRIKVLK